MTTMIVIMMIYHQCQLEVRKPTTCVDFKPFNLLVQEHEYTEPTVSNTTNYILFSFVEMDFSLIWNEHACHTTFS